MRKFMGKKPVDSVVIRSRRGGAIIAVELAQIKANRCIRMYKGIFASQISQQDGNSVRRSDGLERRRLLFPAQLNLDKICAVPIKICTALSKKKKKNRCFMT